MEDAPLPTMISCSITSDQNNIYSLEISSDSNKNFLNIKMISKNKIKEFVYQEKFSFETIKTNKYFSICESMNEALSTLNPIIKNINNIKLIEKTNDLDLIISLPHASCPNITFNIKAKKKEVNDSINELYELIDKLTKKIENQQNIIDGQNNKIKNLEEKIDKVEKVNKKLLEIKKQEEEEKINKTSLAKNSNIIANDYQKEKVIREWINPNENIKFSLLFRKSRDGSNCSDFHRNCDNKGKTLTIIETDKGYKFGGYTPLDWESNSGNKIDEITFLFSLNQMKKFTKIKNSRSIYVTKDFGPVFGSGTDLYINKNMNTGVSDFSNGTFLNSGELTGGENNFNVKEIEVFQIDFF